MIKQLNEKLFDGKPQGAQIRDSAHEPAFRPPRPTLVNDSVKL